MILMRLWNYRKGLKDSKSNLRRFFKSKLLILCQDGMRSTGFEEGVETVEFVEVLIMNADFTLFS